MQGRYIPVLYDLYDLYALYDLYDLDHTAGWEPYNLHDLGQVSWIRSELYRSWTTSHAGRIGSRRVRSGHVRRVKHSQQLV